MCKPSSVLGFLIFNPFFFTMSVFMKENNRILKCSKKNSLQRTESLKGAYSPGDIISKTLGPLNSSLKKSTKRQTNYTLVAKTSVITANLFTDHGGFKLACTNKKQYFTFSSWGVGKGTAEELFPFSYFTLLKQVVLFQMSNLSS